VGNLAAGNHTVTAFGFDSDGAFVQLQGSRTIVIVANTQPFGFVDSAQNANGSSSMSVGSVLTVSGWAADLEDGTPVTRVDVRVDGQVQGLATLGLARPDVASVTGHPEYGLAGWSASFSTSS